MSHSIIHAIPVPAILITDEDRLIDANKAFRKVFPKAQMGRSYLTVLRQPVLVEMVEKLRVEQQVDPAELMISGQDQGYYRATGGTLGNDVLICFQDLNETTAAIQMRQNFVADLSHELKTPLTAISGILETSLDDLDALEHFLPVLSGEVERMKRLVADLLILSRVESNARRIPTDTIELRTVVEKACGPLAILAQETGIRIVHNLPVEPIRFQGDQDEIIRAIMNLVENGLRYGNRGGVVEVRGSVSGTSGGAPSVLIEITNDSLGIDGHHIPRLTERFYRIDGHRSRDSGGSGLGLAIVKHVVNHHRGRMSISSRDQKFTVSVVLPARYEIS